MKREKIIHLVLAISLLINVVLMAYILLDEDDGLDINGNLGASNGGGEFNETFVYGTHVLPFNETFHIGNYSFFYERTGWNIRVTERADNRFSGHFWRLSKGKEYGMNEFMMNILSVSEHNITAEFSPYNESDFLGMGVFSQARYNKTLKFGGNETLAYREFHYDNETAEIDVMTDDENYTIWVPAVTETDLGFITIWIRHGGYIECK